MPETLNRPRLAVASETHRFHSRKDKDAEAKLLEVLEEQFKYTDNVFVNKPEDLLMSKSAKVQGKYRLTTQALSQLCSRLAPGYAQTIHDIAGTRRAESQDSEEYDLQLAISITNRLIKLRFNRLNGYCMILDRNKKRIDGFVGRKYAHFSNLDLYKRVKEFTKSAKPSAAFCDGALSGRRIMVRFMNSEPIFDIPTLGTAFEPYYGGYHFANSEIGDCSIKAGAAIIRRRTDGKAVSDFANGSRLAHVKGRRFEERFFHLLDSVQLKADKVGEFQKNLVRLQAEPLKLGGDEESHKKRKKAIVLRLHRSGLTKKTAEAVVGRALMKGSYKTSELVSGQDPMRVFSQRTAYDIFNALTMEAKRHTVDVQEKVEQIAFKLMSGGFTIV